MTLEVKIGLPNSKDCIDIVVYPDSGQHITTMAGTTSFSVTLFGINPRELIDALSLATIKAEYAGREKPLQATVLPEWEYTPTQEDADMELYYEQKHPEVHKW